MTKTAFTTPPATLNVSSNSYGDMKITLKIEGGGLESLGASKFAEFLVTILHEIGIRSEIISRIIKEDPLKRERITI